MLPPDVRLLFELSGEHPTLPRAELSALLHSFGAPAEVPPGRAVVLNTAVDPKLLASRLALTHFVHEEIASGTFQEIVAAAGGLQPEGTFSVRVKSYVTCHGREEMERKVADQIRGKVDLDHPAVEYVVLITADGHHLTRRIAATARAGFEARRPSSRPFFHPTALHPRFARALVNLTACPPGGTILDPFCGTGSLLVEAALCGFQARGLDASGEMIAGASEILDAYGVAAELRIGDVALLGEAGAVDAIVTDPPYGRSASTYREPVPDLYRRFFAATAQLKSGTPVAVILPAEEHVALAEEHLAREQVHRARVHRSLDRHFCVFRVR